MDRIRKQFTFSNATALVALFVALAGTSYAAVMVTGGDVKNRSLTGRDVKRDSLSGRQVRERTLDLSAQLGGLQRRVSGECQPGGAIRSVAADGTVACEVDDVGGGGGGPTGPAGGDLTGTYPDPTIANGAVGSAELAAGAVTASKISTVLRISAATTLPGGGAVVGAVADCNPGEKAVGGGVQDGLPGTTAGLFVTDTRPLGTVGEPATSWYGEMQNTTATATVVTTWVVCITA